MLQETFFKSVETQLDSSLPFVVFRKPNETKLKGYFQEDDSLNYVSSYNEIGFVFAPFDTSQKAVLFPIDNGFQLECSFKISEKKTNTTNGVVDSNIEALHKALVQKGIDAITNGTLNKVVLSRCEIAQDIQEHPMTIFKRLLSRYENAFVYCWYHPKVGLWLGATPETLVEVSGNRFKTMSLAGTQDYVVNEAVIWNPKEIEEQQIVTDFITEKFESLTEALSVSEPKTTIAGHLAHLRSDIKGILKADLKSVIQHLHPTPAVCGFPVAASKAFILENEHYDREFYTGFLGELNIQTKRTRNTNRRNVENNAYASVTKTSHFFVNLRCMKLEASKAYIYVGGGITSESDPKKEWLETVSKSKTIRRVL